jgi:putative hemolysin
MIVNQVILLFILLLLSGFFSSAETALFSISQTRARHMAKENIRSHQLIKRLKDDPHKLLTTILIGNNVVNVAASAIATSLTIGMSANYAVGLSTGIMTFLILVFGEVIPKSFATRNNILIAKLTIFPIYWMSVLFLPDHPVSQFHSPHHRQDEQDALSHRGGTDHLCRSGGGTGGNQGRRAGDDSQRL